jgi:23S rRNA pseudouridine1911/1915/1917 synthase
MEPEVIYQDKYMMVLNKLSGWITNEADTTKEIPVIQTWLKDNFKYEIAKSKELRSGIVHRLDKETSGILLVAKIEKAFFDLQAQFKERKVKKTYLALVHNKLEPTTGEINIDVGRLPWNRERFGILPGGRESETEYEVLEYFAKDKEIFSLVKFSPKTGRTHQIRIHAKYLHHPVVSDTFYAGRKTSRKDRLWCPRLFLHAASITFTHPGTGKSVAFNAPLPSDLQDCLNSVVTPSVS